MIPRINLVYLFIFFSISLFMLPDLVQAQRKLKWKDVYPYLESGDLKNGLPIVREFLLSEPDHSSANFQMANIYLERFYSMDPLTQFDTRVKNAERANLHFIKSKVLVDEKEAKRNSKYYSNFETLNDKGKMKVDPEFIVQIVDSGFYAVDHFLKKGKIVHYHFTKGVENYDRSGKYYDQINRKYPTLKELYLQYDDKVKELLDKMITTYDSALYHLDQLKLALGDYPIEDYLPQYQERTIKTYRLDGLDTDTNFLQNNLSLWNYGKWAKEINSTVNGEIDDLRQSIQKNHAKFLSTEDRIKELDPLLDSIALVTLDRSLVFRLRRYDPSTFLLPLLQYQEKKQDLYKTNYFDLQRTQDQNRKLNLLGRGIHQSNQLTAFLEETEERSDALALFKQRDYISKNFTNEAAYLDFLKNEKKKVNEYKTSFADSIYDILMTASYDPMSPPQLHSFKERTFPTKVVGFRQDMLIGNNAITLYKLENAEGAELYGGAFFNQKNSRYNVFIAKVISDEVLWLKEFNEKIDDNDTDNYLGGITATSDGYAFNLFLSNRETGDTKNLIFSLDNEGEITNRMSSFSSKFPRSILYNEFNSSYTCIYHGEAYYNQLEHEGEAEVINLNKDQFVFWRSKFNLNGTIEALFSFGEETLLIGNLREISFEDGKSQKNNYISPFGIQLSAQGERISFQVFDSGRSYFTNNVVKVNSEQINLIGYTGSSRQAAFMAQPDVHHIISSDLDTVYKRIGF
ncbi:MAG: hypothetical protein LAT68_12125 [Cyclobacteriaceae bacterium]|nr:hypothetical protein [Cyclobacteriaceae bacterium]MCH8517064.1 hypothetical protein [Cyclobacteriaceae bacterium]